MIRNILNLVRFQLRVDFDESSLDYNRFVIHLRYLAQRVLSAKPGRGDELDLGGEFKRKFPREYKCAEKIGQYIKKQHGATITQDDTLFLAVHIHRLTRSTAEV